VDTLFITSYKKKYASAFYSLNKAWITEQWDLEDSDLKDLLDPEDAIINKGGEIFFAINKKTPIGTAAMIPHQSGFYELAKMTIEKNYRGLGIANLLLDKCILFAKEEKAREIFLISNRSLLIARKLYDKYGFKEVPLDSQKYERGDVKMCLKL